MRLMFEARRSATTMAVGARRRAPRVAEIAQESLAGGGGRRAGPRSQWGRRRA